MRAHAWTVHRLVQARPGCAGHHACRTGCHPRKQGALLTLVVQGLPLNLDPVLV